MKSKSKTGFSVSSAFHPVLG